MLIRIISIQPFEFSIRFALISGPAIHFAVFSLQRVRFYQSTVEKCQLDGFSQGAVFNQYVSPKLAKLVVQISNMLSNIELNALISELFLQKHQPVSSSHVYISNSACIHNDLLRIRFHRSFQIILK